MPDLRRTSRNTRAAAILALAILATPGTLPTSAVTRADGIPPGPTDSSEPNPARRPFPTRDASGLRRGPARPEGQGGGSWWIGSAGVALALAVGGWASLASRRYSPKTGAGATGLRVVGRTSLSPRHTVYLLQAGDRVLIVGTGPQGAPSLLGEMTGGGAASDDRCPSPDGRGQRLDIRLGNES